MTSYIKFEKDGPTFLQQETDMIHTQASIDMGIVKGKVVHHRTAPRGRSSAKTLQMEQVKPSKKVGRNDPCPCGSGLKSKRCHDGVLVPRMDQIER